MRSGGDSMASSSEVTSSPAPQGAAGFEWQRLAVLADQLEANCAALAGRMPELAATVRAHRPAGEYVIAVQGDKVIIASLEGQTGHVRPCRLSATAAHQTLERVFPAGACTEAVLIAGVDQGWLWEQLYS